MRYKIRSGLDYSFPLLLVAALVVLRVSVIFKNYRYRFFDLDCYVLVLAMLNSTLQKYCFFLNYQNFLEEKCKKIDLSSKILLRRVNPLQDLAVCVRRYTYRRYIDALQLYFQNCVLLHILRLWL